MVAWRGGCNPLCANPEATEQRSPLDPPCLTLSGDQARVPQQQQQQQQQQPCRSQPLPQQQHIKQPPRSQQPRTGTATQAPRREESEPNTYTKMHAAQLLAQLMPTLVGDQIPLAAEALSQLRAWTHGLWGHPIQLVEDSGTTATVSEDTIPWLPPPPLPAQNPGAACEGATDLWQPAGTRTPPRSEEDDDADMHGTETEDDMWHYPRAQLQCLFDCFVRGGNMGTLSDGGCMHVAGNSTDTKHHLNHYGCAGTSVCDVRLTYLSLSPFGFLTHRPPHPSTAPPPARRPRLYEAFL